MPTSLHAWECNISEEKYFEKRLDVQQGRRYTMVTK